MFAVYTILMLCTMQSLGPGGNRTSAGGPQAEGADPEPGGFSEGER